MICTHASVSPEETQAIAARLASVLGPGDTLLLDGAVGAGKTHFARALVHALQDLHGLPREDVPSPTFTLVQTYDLGAFEVWHADLYRLSGPDEVLELGLDLAFTDGVCLIEWPDRLGAACPPDAVRCQFETGPGADDRSLAFSGPQGRLARWMEALDDAA